MSATPSPHEPSPIIAEHHPKPSLEAPVTLTPVPESGSETVEDDISLPFSLYFAALNCPHWSTYDQGDEKARREAESKRNVERQRRMAQVTRLHDKLHHLKTALSDVVNLDRNGLTDSAAEHVERSTQQFADEAKQLVAAMRADAATWRANGQAAMEQLEEEPAARPRPASGGGILPIPSHRRIDGDSGIPAAAPPEGGISIVVNPSSVPTPAEIAQIVAARRPAASWNAR